MDHEEALRRVQACLDLLARELGVSAGTTRRSGAWAVIASINDEIGTLCEVTKAGPSGVTARFRGGIPPDGVVCVSCVVRSQPGLECEMKVQYAEYERQDVWLVRLAPDRGEG